MRMQTAYAIGHRALKDVTNAKNVEQAELEEARTRARHLKLQAEACMLELMSKMRL